MTTQLPSQTKAKGARACGLIIIIIINIKCHYSCLGFISMKLSKRRNLVFNCVSADRIKMLHPDELIRVREKNPGKYSGVHAERWALSVEQSTNCLEKLYLCADINLMLTSSQNRRATPAKGASEIYLADFPSVALDETAQNSCTCCESCWCCCICKMRRGYKIKFQLLTNIYVLPDKSGIKTFPQSAK